MGGEGWKQHALASLADYHNGRAFKPKDWGKSGLPIIRIAQMTKPNAETDCYEGTDVEARHLIDDGDLLFSWSATLAVMEWNRGPAILNQHIFKVEEKPGVDRNFLRYLLQNSIDALADHSHGSTMKHIRKGVLNDFMVLVPPLPEQRAIAEILTSVDDAIRATEAVIEQTRRVKQGLLGELLTRGIGHTRFKMTEVGEVPEGWEVKQMAEVAAFITSGSRGWAEYYSSDGPLFIRSQNVRNGCLDFSDRQCVNPPAGAEGTRTQVRAGDVLVTITGNSVGNVAYVPAELGEAYVSQHVGLIRLSEPTFHRFVVAYFSPDGPGNKQILNAQYGQSKPGLSLQNLRQLMIAIPPDDELLRITQVIIAWQSQLDAVVAELYRLASLNRGLMQDLLSGRVRVK